MSELRPGLSIVIPVYNSAPILPELVTRLEPVLEALDLPHELILINDCSPDSSWDVVQSLAADRPWVRGVDLMRNYGQHNALLAGVRLAHYEIIVTMDDDLQHPPEEIPRLLAVLDQGYDVVYGPPQEEQHGLWRDLASQTTKLALKMAMGVDVARHVSAFRAFRTQVREAFATYGGPYVSIDVLLSWGTARFGVAPVRHDARAVGKSNYTFRKLARHAINMITGFSTVPLRIASYMGFAFTLFGMAVLAFVLIRFLIGGAVVQGFAFTASTIAIFSGAQLFALGIIGEYFARMYLRVMDRPTYTIRGTVGPGSEGER